MVLLAPTRADAENKPDKAATETCCERSGRSRELLCVSAEIVLDVEVEPTFGTYQLEQPLTVVLICIGASDQAGAALMISVAFSATA